MPIYEYRCNRCSHEAEVWARMSDPPPECPECDAGAMSKRVSLTSFQLKGGGWYAQGYGALGAKKDDGGNGKGASAETKSAESKPAETKSSEPAKTDAAPKPAAPASAD